MFGYAEFSNADIEAWDTNAILVRVSTYSCSILFVVAYSMRLKFDKLALALMCVCNRLLNTNTGFKFTITAYIIYHCTNTTLLLSDRCFGYEIFNADIGAGTSTTTMLSSGANMVFCCSSMNNEYK